MFPELIIGLLKNGYKVSFSAPGHSMFPTIMDNETVVVEPIEPFAVHKGDIVLYRSNGDLIAHRVMGILTKDKADQYALLFNAFSPTKEQTVSPDANHQSSQHASLSPSHFFILRGDAALDFDEPITSDQVLGKVISIERNGSSLNP
jgi:signal peptidase I